MIKINNASFKYKNYEIFNDFSLELNKGETLAILGQNGTGKTTLVKCLLGFLKLNSGDIYINDKSLKTYSQKDLFSLISYVPQAKNNNLSISVFDMVLLGRSNCFNFFPNHNDYAATNEILKELEIYHLKDKACYMLSGGEFVMVMFARALVVKKDILILDEIESNLDFKNQLFILEFLKYLKQEKNITLIFNTHFPEHAKELCDKVIFKYKHSLTTGHNQDINECNLSKLYECVIKIKNDNDKYFIKAVKGA